jgi:hypothetical protein
VARTARREILEGREPMFQRIAPLLCAAVLVLATGASAQSEIRGVVSYVDPATRTIYFTDGRIVQLKSGSTVMISGQPVLLESVRPGATVVMLEPGTTATTVTTVTQQTQTVPAPAPPAPVNVTGTIARIDPMTQTITFQDGRMVRATGQTVVWQQTPAVSSLQPGTQVFVSNATPVGYVPSSAVSAAPASQWMMGTVSQVDTSAQQIVLNDGTVVYVGPNASVRAGNDRVGFTRLRPGDEIVIQTRPLVIAQPSTGYVAPGGVTVTTAQPAGRDAGSALPYQGYADSRIEASDVQIVWSPQAR